MRIVYLSGPITGTEDYAERFDYTEGQLLEEGFITINPVRVNRHKDMAGATYEELMERCLEMIDRADVVCMLDGWKESRGANREYGYALAKGKQIIEEDRFGFLIGEDRFGFFH